MSDDSGRPSSASVSELSLESSRQSASGGDPVDAVAESLSQSNLDAAPSASTSVRSAASGSAAAGGEGCRLLLLGGTGFIGRHFLAYCVENKFCSKIRVVDKRLPVMVHLTADMKPAYDDLTVEFMQGDLSKEATVTKAFTDDEKFDFVVNLAGETKFGMDDEVYEKNCLTVSVNCAMEAAKHGVKRFVEVSMAQVYQPAHVAARQVKEGSKLAPWTKQAKYKLQAEEALQKIEGLPLIILRPAIVYGVGDTHGLCPRIVCAGVYTELKEKMKCLWSGDLKINTVHVSDVANAIWHTLQAPNMEGKIFNLVDKNHTNQKKFNELLSSLFDIRTGFVGTIICSLAKVHFGAFVEGVNDKHLAPWSALCKKHNVLNTHLTPYIDRELLMDHHLSIDGTAIEETGFTYQVPKVTLAELKKQVEGYIEVGLYPPILV